MSNDIIVFTLHKSASIFLNNQCQVLSKLSNINYYTPSRTNTEWNARSVLVDKDLWLNNHGCFAPIRFFVEVPQLEDYEIILHLRDPRDALVSMFYSYCYIHRGELEKGTGYRREVAEEGIDAFVLGMCSDKSLKYKGDYGTGGHLLDLIGNFPKRYQDYIDNLIGKPNVVLLKYEEMVSDYPSWLEKFIKPFPIENKERVRQELVALSPTFFPERSKDVMTHRRHITPGDHKDKLKQETIEQLNEIFVSTLDVLDYQ